MTFSLTRKGKLLRLKSSLSEGPGPGWRSRPQLVAFSGPGPQNLSSCHCWGSQTPRKQLALRPLGCPNGGAVLTDGFPGRWPLPLGCGVRVGSSLPQGLLGPASGQPCKTCGALQDTAPACSLGPLLLTGPKPGELAGPWGEGWDPPLISLLHLRTTTLPEDHHSTDCWSNSITKVTPLRVVARRPTVAPTSDWAGPLMALQKLLPGNRCGVRASTNIFVLRAVNGCALL